MNHIIVTVAKYLNLLFVILYTLKCFSYFTAKNKKKRNSNLNKQIFYIFAMHFLCHVCLYINTEKAYIIYYYLIEISIAIFYIVLFHFAYKHASRLITNNIVFLMLVGYTMLTRLNMQRAIKQFILATAALFICSFIPFIMGKLKDMHKWNMRYAVLGLLLLISVFVPGLGYEAWGSRNWIHIDGEKYYCDPKTAILTTGLKTINGKQYYFGEFLYHYQHKYKVDLNEAERVLITYLVLHLTKHMACRVGIENWPSEAIAKWVKNYFGPKKLAYVITDAHHIWEKQQNNNQYEQNQF